MLTMAIDIAMTFKISSMIFLISIFFLLSIDFGRLPVDLE